MFEKIQYPFIIKQLIKWKQRELPQSDKGMYEKPIASVIFKLKDIILIPPNQEQNKDTDSDLYIELEILAFTIR